MKNSFAVLLMKCVLKVRFVAAQRGSANTLNLAPWRKDKLEALDGGVLRSRCLRREPRGRAGEGTLEVPVAVIEIVD